jgi:predicted transcriptional regulator YdeE
LYTCYLGEEVKEKGSLDEGLSFLILQEGLYVKFTSDPGPMAASSQNMWKSIWNMNPEELGGHRLYQTDFEIYEQDVVCIYLGLRP